MIGKVECNLIRINIISMGQTKFEKFKVFRVFDISYFLVVASGYELY